MRLIDADAIELPYKTTSGVNSQVALLVRCIIKDAPTIDAEPVRHGEWEVVDEVEPRRYGCSSCKRISWNRSNYCPNCGAKMDGGEK